MQQQNTLGFLCKQKTMDHDKQIDPKQEEDEEDINKFLLGIMGNYSDSVIPPLSQLCPIFNENNNNNIKGIITGSSSRKTWMPKTEAKDKDQELNIERVRRLKMADNYALLQSMVPNLLPKAKREKIVSGTIEYIAVLKKELNKLQELKNSSGSKMANWKTLSQCTNWNTTINLNVYGKVAFFGIQSVARRGLVTQIFMVFHNHKAEVLASSVAVNNGQLTLTVTSNVSGNKDYNVEEIKRDILAL